MGDSAADAGGEALIQRVADHFFDDDFQTTVDKFISDNCGPFEDVAEETTELGDDNKLEYWEVYQQFVKLFEGKLEAFLTKEGTTPSKFYSLCKAVTRKGDEWSEAATFVNLLVATSEYPAFLALMADEARDAKERREGEAIAAERAAKQAGDEDGDDAGGAGGGAGAQSDSKK